MHRVQHILPVLWTTLFLCVSAPAHVRAELLAREAFDYSASQSVIGQGGGSGWDGPWSGPSASARIVESSERIEGVPVLGNEVVLDGNTRIFRMLDVSPAGPFDRVGLVENDHIGKAGTTLYVGFRQRISIVPDGKPSSAAYLRYYAFEFNVSGSDVNRVLEIGHDDRSNRPSGPYYGVASVANNQRSDVEPGQFQSLGAQDTQSNVIVVKFTFGPNDGDTAQVLRNPESRTDESASTIDATLRGNFEFDRIALARFVGNEPVHAIDEIRIGTDYDDVFMRVDRQQIAAALARAETELQRKIATCQAKIDALAAKGKNTADLQARIADLLRPNEQTSPWDRLKSLENIVRSVEAAELELGIDKLLFVKRHMFRPTHIYTEFSDGPYRPGGGVFVLSPVRFDGKTTMIFDAGTGIVRDPEVSFDARRVLLSYRATEDGHYHIYEMNIDGTGLRQITDGPFHDLDPFYLPDGRIGFTSSRCKSRALCFWVHAATLFAMNADGSNIQALTSNNVNEFTPQMLPDGRILYTRWEYMDKTAIFVQSLWSINPDGTRAQQIYGNNLIHPVSLLQARRVPGTSKIACIMGAHNGDSVGPLAVVDPTQGVNNIDAIVDLTPESDYHSGCFAPYPLNDLWCLVSYGPQEPFGIYAFGIDPPDEAIASRQAEVPDQSPQHPRGLSQYFRSATWNRHLVYRDDVYSCVEAIPVAPREVPGEVASTLASSQQHPDNDGTLLLVDVYQGLGDSVSRGMVKYLRIVEEMGHRDRAGARDFAGAFSMSQFQQTHTPNFMDMYASPWESGKPAPSLQAKHVYGTVPVEPDGSALFKVPTERPIYFQALDEDYNEIQRMRSYIHAKPGERLTCIGCHEHRQTSPPSNVAQLPLALGREPSLIEPPPFGAGAFSYSKLVQPILDERCVQCHGAEKLAGGIELTGKRDGRGVPASFFALVRPRVDPDRPPLVDFFDNWWGVSSTVPVAQPRTFGTSVSRLIEVIDDNHKGISMTDQDRERLQLSPTERRIITTWIDLNCPLWNDYCPECRLAGS